MKQHHKSIGKYCSIISRQFQIYISRELREYGIKGSEYIFLVNVFDHEKANQKALCEEHVVDQALATRALVSLEEKGLVIREKNPADKREYFISLTDKGKKMRSIIQDKLEAWTKILAGDMTDKEVDKVVKKLELFSQNALKEIADEK